MRRIDQVRIALILSLLVVVMASGCGYSLQGRADLPFREVAIGKIANNTAEPKLQDRMHRLLAETFMEYGVDVQKYARYRIQGEFIKFEVIPVAEKDLMAVEYQINVTGSFKIIDTETTLAIKPGMMPAMKKDHKKAIYKEEDLGEITNPYLTYFRSSGLLVNVLAAKEIATEKALKDLSQEVVMRIIYKLPKADDKAKKGNNKVEPKTVPAGSR